MRYILLPIAVLFVISFASASTSIIIYLDESGKATLIGDSNSSQNLPSWILFNEGSLTGTTSNLTTKQGDIWSFFISLPDSNITLVLPPGAVLRNSSTELSASKERIELHSKNKIYAQYYLEVQNKGYSLYFIPIIILATGAGYWLFVRKKEKEREEAVKRSLLQSVLNEREKCIIEMLQKSGKIKNSYLRRLCDIPKASFSRHVSELEKKNLIKRYGEGKNKYLELVP
ncbi:winged helix-turn-helix transcriptional regulator [Candidatus Pacearchaeota archaeon]|nr:winged helix-turn-helix transcriptional regulator [Candidatus Pacearchaeota archaeon]